MAAWSAVTVTEAVSKSLPSLLLKISERDCGISLLPSGEIVADKPLPVIFRPSVPLET